MTDKEKRADDVTDITPHELMTPMPMAEPLRRFAMAAGGASAPRNPWRASGVPWPPVARLN